MKPSSEWKGNQLYRRAYLPMIHQTRVWSPKYIKNSYNSTPGIKMIQFFKMCKRSGSTLLQGELAALKRD